MMQPRPILVHLQPLLRQAFLFIVLAYLLVFASSHNGLVNRLVLTITAVIITLIALFFVLRKREQMLKVELPLWVFLIVILLASVTSIDPRRSLMEVWLVGLMIVLVLIAAELVRRGWSAHTWITVLLMVGAVMMILAWIEVFAWHLQSFRVTGSLIPSIHFRLSVPNFIGVFLNILLMPALALLVTARSVGQRLAHAFWVLSAILLIYLTSSRGAWLGTISGVAALTLIFVLRQPGTLQHWIDYLRSRKWLLVVLAVSLTAGLAILILLFISQSQHPTHASSILQSRSEFWGPAWHAFLEKPLLGKGPYTFVSHYLTANSVPPGSLFVYAHSIYMDLLSGSGLIGLAAFLWLAVTVIRSLQSGLRSADPLDFPVIAGVLGSIAAFLVHGIFDSVHHTIPTAGWTFAFLLGAALGARGEYQTSVFDLPRWLSVSVALAAWVNIWMLVPLDRAVQQARMDAWSQAEPAAQIALARDPLLATAYQQAGMIQSHLASKGEQPALQRSIKSWYQAVVMDPAWALNHANYGIMLRFDRQLDRSEAVLSQAVDLASGSAIYWLNYGVTLEQNSKSDEAILAYHRALDFRPNEQPAYFWRETSLRQQAWQTWLAGQPDRPETTLAELRSIATVDPDLAVNHVALARASLTIQDYHQVADSLALARLAYASTPGISVEIDWLTAELFAGQGDFDQAVAYGSRALANQIEQGLFGPGSYGTLYYAELMFRRPALPMDLVPQAARVILPDMWGRRVLRLVEWHRAQDEDSSAEALLQQLALWIPDYPYILLEGGP